jgi:predicted permease
MNFKLTILNTSAFLYLFCCIFYTLLNYSVLSDNEGWGIAYMIVLFILGLSALLVDFILRRIFKEKKTQQIVSAAATVFYAIVIYMGS